MPSQSDISASIIQALGITDPDLDTSIGTTSRKIIDACAGAMADNSTDDHLLNYQYDIESKQGADLDTFVQLFGLARIGARRATGSVLFSRSADAAGVSSVIPVNTSVATADGTVTATTTLPVVFSPTQLAAVVPAMATLGGSAGNTGSGTLVQILSPLTSITNVTNIQALTNGTDQETDAQLRTRWKQTVFRNLAGTEQMYLGIALDDPDCYAANVIGASRTWKEQLQMQTVGPNVQATSTLSSAVFIYPDTITVTRSAVASSTTLSGDTTLPTVSVLTVASTSGFSASGSLSVNGVAVTYSAISGSTFTGVALDTDNSAISTTLPNGSAVIQTDVNGDVMLLNYDYTFNTTVNPPIITSTGTNSRISNGANYDVSYEYVPSASRNIPQKYINNRIDVWCAGQRVIPAQQTVIFSGANIFTNTSTDIYYAPLYIRPDGTTPNAVLTAPIANTPTTAGSGGTFTAGTYFYKITAINSTGESLPSNEVSHSVVLNGTLTPTWAAVTGATGYKVYRGTSAGAENKLVTTTGAVTTFTDTGTAGTTATVPSANTSGSVIVPLAFGPILSLPSTITVSAVVYTYGTDYWIVHRNDAFGYTPNSIFGIEWRVAHKPADNTTVTIGTNSDTSTGYSYNDVPRAIQAQVDNWRLVGTDAKAHSAKTISLRVNLAMMYSRNSAPSVVNSNVEQALASFLQSLNFGTTMQASDVLSVVSRVPGVDNVRFLDASDFPSYTSMTANNFNVGIQSVIPNSGSLTVINSYVNTTNGRAIDVTFDASQVLVLDSTNGLFVQRLAQNNFYSSSGGF